MTTITADYFNSVALPSQSHSIRGANSLARDSKLIAGGAATPLHAQAAAELGRLARECAEVGWDGFTGKAIPNVVLVRAARFLCALPPWMAAPDIVPEADGNVAIEWYFAPHRSFSVSIGEQGALHYAGLFGGEEEIHGLAPFLDEVPQSVVQLLARLVRETNASRAA